MVKRVLKGAAAEWPLRNVICWRRAHGAHGEVAITFDDGPDQTHTSRVLQQLAQEQVQATFFVLGRQVERFPDILVSIQEAGHEIGIHGYDHSSVNLPAQIRRTAAILQRLGARARLFRPPGGRLDARTLLWAVAYRMPICLWSFDAEDSRRYEGKSHTRRPFSEIASGDVILLHDDNPVCLEELPELLDSLRRGGLHPVTLSTLLALK